MRFTTRKLVFAAMIGGLYLALTMMAIGISFGPVQFRVSEVLCVLPFLFPECAPGLFIGCLLSNLFSNYGIPDVVFGSLATLLAAVLTSKCKNKFLAPIPPIIINAVVVGAIITYYEGAGLAPFPLFAAQVGFGELVVCAGLGIPLLLTLEKLKIKQTFSL